MTQASKPLSFVAEIKQVTSKKTASLDVSYQLLLLTDDPTVMSLGLLDGNTLIKVSVEVV